MVKDRIVYYICGLTFVLSGFMTSWVSYIQSYIPLLGFYDHNQALVKARKAYSYEATYWSDINIDLFRILKNNKSLNPIKDEDWDTYNDNMKKMSSQLVYRDLTQ